MSTYGNRSARAQAEYMEDNDRTWSCGLYSGLSRSEQAERDRWRKEVDRERAKYREENSETVY